MTGTLNVLNLQKMDEGKLVLEPVVFNLIDVATFKSMASSDLVSLEYYVSANILPQLGRLIGNNFKLEHV